MENTINNKKIKKPKPAGNLACKLTLIFQIILVVSLGAIALAPFLTGFFGVVMFLFACCGVVITTLVTAGIAWTSSAFSGFWGGTFNWIFQIFSAPDIIRDSLREYIVLISILMFVFSASGFIVNLIYFIKHRENKGKFIVSCVFLVLGILNLILAIAIYTNI